MLGDGALWKGWCKMAEVDQLCVELELTPKVKMMEFIALPQVCAMGVVEYLHGLGMGKQVGIGWPADLVARRAQAPEPGGEKPREAMSADTASFDFDLFMGKVGVHAHAGEAGPAASVTLSVDMPVLAGAAERSGVELPVRDELRVQLAAAIEHKVAAWEQLLATRPSPGPMAPVLSDYFDLVPLLGHKAAALSPNGLPVAVGTFTGLDIWGRACITAADGSEQELPSEAVIVRAI